MFSASTHHRGRSPCSWTAPRSPSEPGDSCPFCSSSSISSLSRHPGTHPAFCRQPRVVDGAATMVPHCANTSQPLVLAPRVLCPKPTRTFTNFWHPSSPIGVHAVIRTTPKWASPCATGAMGTVYPFFLRSSSLCPRPESREGTMGKKSLWIAGALLGFTAAACNSVTTLPDTQVRAPGSRLHDGGLGLGSGGVMPPAPGDSTNSLAPLNTDATATCVSLGGLGLGSGGKDECP